MGCKLCVLEKQWGCWHNIFNISSWLLLPDVSINIHPVYIPAGTSCWGCGVLLYVYLFIYICLYKSPSLIPDLPPGSVQVQTHWYWGRQWGKEAGLNIFEHSITPQWNVVFNQWPDVVSLTSHDTPSPTTEQSHTPRTLPASSGWSWRRRWGSPRWGWCRAPWGRRCRAGGPGPDPTWTGSPAGLTGSCRAGRWGRWSGCSRWDWAAGGSVKQC